MDLPSENVKNLFCQHSLGWIIKLYWITPSNFCRVHNFLLHGTRLFLVRNDKSVCASSTSNSESEIIVNSRWTKKKLFQRGEREKHFKLLFMSLTVLGSHVHGRREGFDNVFHFTLHICCFPNALDTLAHSPRLQPHIVQCDHNHKLLPTFN